MTTISRNIIDLQTNDRLTVAQANRLPRIAGKTQITDKTHPLAMADNGLAWEMPADKPGDDYDQAPPMKGADGVFREVWVLRVVTAADLYQLKVSATQQVNAIFEERTRAALNAWYPEFEQLTWPQQETDARAWVEGTAASTPHIDDLLPDPASDAFLYEAARSALCAKIIQNADGYRKAALQQTKILQAHRVAIWAATEKPEIDAVMAAVLAD